MLGRAHIQNVDNRWMDEKLEAHALTLENRQPDPYQYKFFAVTWAIEGAHRLTGVSLASLYRANIYLSLLALLLAHHAWIASLYGARAAVVGTLLLSALAHVMFLDYYHHPYEFWGVAGFCLLLRLVERRASTAALAGLALACGFFWEKHALVPILWAWKRRREGAPLVSAALRGLAVLASALAWPAAVRWICGTDRPFVDVTPLSAQSWRSVLANHLPLIAAPLAVLVARWRDIPPWVRLLWLYVPVLVAAYVADRHALYELRSFWAFVPVFTATICAWLRLPAAAERDGAVVGS